MHHTADSLLRLRTSELYHVRMNVENSNIVSAQQKDKDDLYFLMLQSLYNVSICDISQQMSCVTGLLGAILIDLLLLVFLADNIKKIFYSSLIGGSFQKKQVGTLRLAVFDQDILYSKINKPQDCLNNHSLHSVYWCTSTFN